MNDIHFVIGTMPSWPHSDDNMSYHAPRRADQPLPCTTNTASYAHSPQSLPRPQHQVCSCTPSARIMATQYAPTTPDTQFASPYHCAAAVQKCSTGLWDDRRLFSKMHSAYGLNFDFWKRNLGFGYNCHAIHFTRFTNNTLFPPTLVLSTATLWFYVPRRSHARRPGPDTIEMEWRESSMSFSVV